MIENDEETIIIRVEDENDQENVEFVHKISNTPTSNSENTRNNTSWSARRRPIANSLPSSL